MPGAGGAGHGDGGGVAGRDAPNGVGHRADSDEGAEKDGACCEYLGRRRDGDHDGGPDQEEADDAAIRQANATIKPRRIGEVDGIVADVGVGADAVLLGGVGLQEALDLGVIVPDAEPVPRQLLVVPVAGVAQLLRHRLVGGVVGGQLAPAVVGVAVHHLAGAVRQGDDVAPPIDFVPVAIRGTVGRGAQQLVRRASVGVEVGVGVDGRAAGQAHLAQQPVAVGELLVEGGLAGLDHVVGGALAGGVVGEGDGERRAVVQLCDLDGAGLAVVAEMGAEQGTVAVIRRLLINARC